MQRRLTMTTLPDLVLERVVGGALFAEFCVFPAGKFIEIHFSSHGKIVGANIVTYLLEKSRVVLQVGVPVCVCVRERERE